MHAILSECRAAVIFASSLFSYLAMINMSDLFSCRDTLFVRAYLLYFNLLVSTHVVFERLSVMQGLQSLPWQIFSQNSLSVPPLKYFRNVGLDHHPLPSPHMKISADLGTLDLSWSGVPPPSPQKMKISEVVCGE